MSKRDLVSKSVMLFVDMFNKIMGEVPLSIGTLTTLISTAATSDLELLIPGEVLPSFWLLKLVFFFFFFFLWFFAYFFVGYVCHVSRVEDFNYV